MISAYGGTAYQASFGFIDRVRPLRASGGNGELDEALIRVVRGETAGDPYLAAPTVVDWDQIDGFRYRGERREEPSHPDLDYLESIKALGDPNTLSIEDLKRPSIRVVGNDGQETTRWSIYQCLVFEIPMHDRRYVLSEGTWFEIDPDFASEVSRQANDLPKATFALPASTNAEHEGAYNRRVATSELLMFDECLFAVGSGRYQKIEVCDLLDIQAKRLIHVKRKTRSSTLSHLLAQGRISATSLKADRDLRRSVRDELESRATGLGVVLDEPFVARDWEIVYAVIAPKPAELVKNLSFFSKLNLVHAAKQLAGALEYKVSVLGIQEEPRVVAPRGRRGQQ